MGFSMKNDHFRTIRRKGRILPAKVQTPADVLTAFLSRAVRDEVPQQHDIAQLHISGDDLPCRGKVISSFFGPDVPSYQRGLPRRWKRSLNQPSDIHHLNLKIIILNTNYIIINTNSDTKEWLFASDRSFSR